MDNAKFHKTKDVKDEMKQLNITPIMNVGYSYKYNPVERFWGQIKMHYRNVLLDKMLKDPGVKATPLKDALNETFTML